MRLSVSSMTLYLCFLALTPCQDVKTTASAGAEAITVQDKHDSPDHDDDCTALCVCSCCGVLAVTPPTVGALAVIQPLPPLGQSDPDCVPGWKPIDLSGRDIQPPRA
ncbi:MAG: hypothetical protein WA952_03945 [Lewinella sp.]